MNDQPDGLGDRSSDPAPPRSPRRSLVRRWANSRWASSRWGRLAIAVMLMAVVALAVDGQRAPADQFGVGAALAAISAYQATVSPTFERVGVSCRFEPTCSHYGHAAIKHRGLVPGGWLAAKRIARCAPWTPVGTVDPPPGPSGSIQPAGSPP